MQEGAGRMVRPVNHGMAIQASSTCVVLTRYGSQSTLRACGTPGSGILAVVRTIVAFRTQEWGTGLEQRSDVGAVRGMASGAVFSRRLMFPQEGAALFCMAAEAGFRDRIFLE